ncbi:MAG: ATP-binding protein [Vulcanimicrobiota bacterium]
MAGAAALLLRPSAGLQPTHVALALAVVATDLAFLLAGTHRFSRVAPGLSLAALYLGPAAGAAAWVGLLVGSLVLLLQVGTKGLGDCARGLIPPLAAFLVATTAAPGKLLVAFEVYLVLALLLPTHSPVFRNDFLVLLATPGLALALGPALAERNPMMLAIVPLAMAAGCLREDGFDSLRRLRASVDRLRSQRQALQETRGELRQARAVARQATVERQRLERLLEAATRMAAVLDEGEIRRAFEASLPGLLPGVRVVWGGSGGVSLDGGSLLADQWPGESRQLADVLAGMLAVSLDKARLHQQVVEALEETHRSQAQMLANSRLAAIGRLAAGVAHELNTPLAAIRLAAEYIDMVVDSQSREKVNPRLELITRSVDKSQQTVARLRSYARPEQSEQPDQEFVVAEVIEDALTMLDHRRSQVGVELTTELDAEARLVGQPVEFYSLVSNLVLNACDALIDQPRRVVRVELRQTGGALELVVEDSGPGVEPELAPHVFEPFFTTKALGAGTGLGLYLGRQAAEAHGGSLELEPGQLGGARFVARWPSSER